MKVNKIESTVQPRHNEVLRDWTICIGNCMVLSSIRDLSSTRKYFEGNLTERVQRAISG